MIHHASFDRFQDKPYVQLPVRCLWKSENAIKIIVGIVRKNKCGPTTHATRKKRKRTKTHTLELWLHPQIDNSLVFERPAERCWWDILCSMWASSEVELRRNPYDQRDTSSYGSPQWGQGRLRKQTTRTVYHRWVIAARSELRYIRIDWIQRIKTLTKPQNISRFDQTCCFKHDIQAPKIIWV